MYEDYFTVDGIRYAVISSENQTAAVVSKGEKYSGDITILSSVGHNGNTYKVTSMEDRLFYQCSDLSSIRLSENITAIEDEAFYQCSNLKSVYIPNNVTEIGERAFYWCSKLTSIDIPDGVTSIGSSAFSGCSSLTSINIPDGVTEIGGAAFSSCGRLTTIDIPDEVTSIGNSAFSSCNSLESVTLGSGVETIGASAFSSCYGLNEIYCAATVPPICGSWCFLGVDTKACTLNVPEGSADDYRVADEWKDFYNIVGTDFSGTEEVAADAAADVKVYAAAGRIVVENAAAGTPIAVYSADGVRIYSGVVSDTFTEIPAPAGKLYIVKCGKAVFKTVM